ncbi:enoyl-CoA hydratase [Cellulomonas aerilata]|uniref:Enoyl-CoA hydratase n=1 Tax=Cellulomonas aerilata TaxID=515326 RepID=A0A512D8Q7_9CELL|nr:enoyl-CoA hydratase [Cellulomonas aerilata]GEO32787.1 enoyl-CoA hydratase [Cellulomonas aerilata]
MTDDADGAEPGVRVHRAGDVLHAVLSNPARRNAITWAMYDQLLAMCERVDADPTLRVVVIRGDGPAFAAGTDIRGFRDFTDGAQGVAYEHRVARVLSALLALRVPVVGVVSGPAVGAGLAVAATCDVLVATPDARFGVPVARTLGNCVPAAVVARLQHRLGVSRAMTLLLTARLLGAEEARESGFVHAVVAPDALEETVADLVSRLAGNAPLSVAAMKEMDRRLHAAALAVQADDLLERCYGSADFREGVAAFLEHRAPTWRGR